jgi:S1-C subfamily serine protease
MQIATGAIALVLCYGSPSLAGEGASLGSAPTDIVEGPVALQTPGTEGKQLAGTGSGFFISTDKLLTNFHVVNGCAALTVGNNTEGKEVDAQLFVNDADADLAVLNATEPNIAPAQFRMTDPEDPRDEFAVVGYPEHGLPVLEAELDRVMVFPDDLAGHGTRYEFYGPIRRGNSGGPLLDWSGAVVGIATAKINTVKVYQRTGVVLDDVGFAIPNRIVFAFLRSHGIAFRSLLAGPSLSQQELLKKAHGFVRQVRCWK